ncbi:hypothetical protein DL764_002413 [Monosporascus ibericus]|uniref:Alcohol acetyltransferase n=1 Tax=Monosporascus ibericus TaxID=155417 RepID=A0A4Q4TLN0_9PEZI|nr:hypothetical protein DL764_002413 [Monosporascus ibericus]
MLDRSQDAIRPVGSSAKFNTSRHSLGLYRCVVNTAQYTTSPPIDKQASISNVIENALATVMMQHGILRVGIADEDTHEPVFTYLRTINLRQMIEWKKISASEPDAYMRDLLRSTEAQHDKLWEDLPGRPGWKLIVYQSAGPDDAENAKIDISFAFHHAYADGQSAVIFHRDLLRALNRGGLPPAELQDHVLHLSERPRLPPGAEELVPFSISWPYLLKRIWAEIIRKELVPSWLKPAPSPDTVPWTGNPINPEPHKANLRLVRVPQAALASLLTACREHGTTLTPLLQVLVLASLASRLQPEAAPAFEFTTAISLRRFANGSDGLFDRADGLHCLITAHAHRVEGPAVSVLRARRGTADRTPTPQDAESTIWGAAAEIGTGLRARVNSLPRDDVAGLTAWVSDWRRRWVGRFGQRRETAWECSNAGSLGSGDAGEGDTPGEGRWRIERNLFSQGATPVGAAFALNVAGVVGRGLWMTVSWQETAVETQLMEGLVGDLQGWVDSVGGTGRFGVFD